MDYTDFALLSSSIHKSLLDVQSLKEELEQIDKMLDDISDKIGHIDEATWRELERSRLNSSN